MIALEARALSKSFGGLRVSADVSFAVEAGERRLIIGPNGAGKTTLFNLITGELRPDTGSVHLLGRDITTVPSRRRAHLGLARTYQIITLFPRDTLLRNVILALLGLSPLRWNPIVGLTSQSALVEQAREALARVGLEGISGRPLAETSYGERRRVEIAMALAQRPKAAAPSPMRPASGRSPGLASRASSTCARPTRPGRRKRQRPAPTALPTPMSPSRAWAGRRRRRSRPCWTSSGPSLRLSSFTANMGAIGPERSSPATASATAAGQTKPPSKKPENTACPNWSAV